MDKVFGLGLGKTGTTTLGYCLDKLGYKIHDGDISLVKPWVNGDMEIFDNLMKNYDAFEDEPWCFMYKELYHKYPNAKYILTIRKNPNIWLRSKLNHSLNTSIRGRMNCAYYNYYCFGYQYVIDNEQKFIDIYNKHNNDVTDYFRDKDNFIKLCWENGDGWNELCSFLNADKPNVSFPIKKKSNYQNLDRLLRLIPKSPNKYLPDLDSVIDYVENK